MMRGKNSRMTDLMEEFASHMHEGLGMLMNDFPHERGSAVEEINRGRDARKMLREWQKLFSAVLDAIDQQEQVLRIMPYDGPGKRHGEPAYDMDGLQMLVEVVDGFSDGQFEVARNRALNWTHGKPHLARAHEKCKNFYFDIKATRDGRLEKPVLEEQE